MSSISSRFYITAINDGTTLHGNLAAKGSLTQMWNGSAAIPNWKTETTKQPVIYLTLLSGSTPEAPDDGFTWYYNGVAITFDASTGISTNPSGLFQKTTEQVTILGNTVVVPALKIIDNLASSNNVDLDTIAFKGSKTIGGSPVAFAASIQVRITTTTANANLGIIEFVGGKSDITEDYQTLTAYGTLYNPDGSPADGVTTQWYVNTSGPINGEQVTIDGTTYKNSITIYEDEEQAATAGKPNNYVVDKAVIRCDFLVGAEKRFTAYAEVDDLTDPEIMYIQFSTEQDSEGNGREAHIRKNQTAYFKFWIGLNTNPAPKTEYNKFKVIFHDAFNVPIGGRDDTNTPKRSGSLATGIPACTNGDAGDGYRDISSLISGGKASLAVHFSTVDDVAKGNLSGNVYAEVSPTT